MKDLLSKVSVRDLERMLEIKRREESVAPLLRKRDELLRELALLEKQISRHHGRKADAPGRATEEAEGAVEAGPGRRGRRALSEAARDRIAAAQRARWAKARAGKPDASSDEEAAAPGEPEATPGTETVEISPDAAPAGKPPKKKRTLSPEARARIVAAQKARWAKAKVGKAAEASPEAGQAEAPPEAEAAAPEPSAVPKPARKPRKKRAAGPDPAPVEGVESPEAAPSPPEEA